MELKKKALNWLMLIGILLASVLSFKVIQSKVAEHRLLNENETISE